ncbi:MAG TPA: gamma-glutamylcyclotransferase [Casimicrobiaceae bacterium]
MTLSRRDLEENRMSALYASATKRQALSAEELSASLNATLAAKPKGAGWWVFGYGSLVWNPLFPVAETEAGTVRGLHRRFCLRSVASRGTPDQPGLVLGLDRGGACRGLVFRLPAPLAVDELHLLWRREMVVGGYVPRWVNVDVDGAQRCALTFVVKRDHPHYTGKLELAEQVRILNCACGAFGSSRDYLNHTRAALAAHRIVDGYLETLAARLAAPALAG